MRKLLTILFALALLGCGGASEREREIWRFAIEETQGSVQDAYAQRFAAKIEERTHGEVDVIVYPYGTLGTSSHITEQLHNGTIELAMASPGHLGNLIPEVQAFLLHFVLGPDERVNAEALRDPELRRYLNELYEEKGLAFLTAFAEGAQVWSTQEEVRRPEDFGGMRFRVMPSPLLVASYAAYGASPTPLPYSEIYSGLQLRMIEGQVNPIFAIEEMSFYEVTDWLIFPRHAEFITTVAANPRWLEGLSPERRRLVEDVVRELQTEIYVVQSRFNRERLEMILERRPEMNVVHLTDEERARFQERAEAIHARYIAMNGARGERLLEILDAAVARADEELGRAEP